MVNKKCSVAFCPGKPRDKLTYYCFPKNPRKNQEWISACNRESDFAPSQASRVCELHFQADDFVPPKDLKSRRRLKDGIVPILNLKPQTKVNTSTDTIGSTYIGGTETIISIPGVSVDIERGYEQMETVMTTTLPKEEETLELTGRSDMDKRMVRRHLLEHEINEEKTKTSTTIASKKSTQMKPPKIKVNPKDLPEDPEVIGSTIGSDEQNYFLSFLPQTEKECVSIEEDKTADRLLPVGPSDLDDDEDLVPEPQLPVENLTPAERIAKLSKQLLIAYKKNATLARKNKSLRLQLYAATKKTLSQKAKLVVAKDVLKPFFTPTQIDCFCRPTWLRSRNWAEEDFEIALALRKLMSKKAFGYLRKKRMVPMPSLTSLRKYNKSRGIVIQHNTMKFAHSRKHSNMRGTKKTKNQSSSTNTILTQLSSTEQSKMRIERPQSELIQQENVKLIQKHESNQQQPVLITSAGELGNVEFLQQTMDDQTGQVITTALPMMTTADGTTVVQLSNNTNEGDDGLGNFTSGQTVQMVMVDPSNPNHFTLQQHPISVATSTSSSPVTTLAFEENSSQSVQQNQRSFARVKNNDGETWKFIQIG